MSTMETEWIKKEIATLRGIASIVIIIIIIIIIIMIIIIMIAPYYASWEPHTVLRFSASLYLDNNPMT